MKKKIAFLIGTGAGLLPLAALAQNANATTALQTISNIVNALVPILITIAIIYLIITIIQYALAGDEEKKGEARGHMIMAIIGIFVIVAIWGLVSFLINTFGLNTTTIAPPSVCPTGTNWNVTTLLCQ